MVLPKFWVRFFFIALLAAPLGACKKEVDSGAKAPESELYKTGRVVYMSRCISCHSTDSRKNGPLGPAAWGSSRELLEMRVVHGTYPEGYTPKNNSKLMLPMPELAKDIDALYEYLNTAK